VRYCAVLVSSAVSVTVLFNDIML